METAAAEPLREAYRAGEHSTFVEARGAPGARQFVFVAEHARRTIQELAGWQHVETGSAVFDGLFALSLEEVRENSVKEIRAHAFNNGSPIPLEAFETGEMWQYVWTRDVSYAIDLGLASLDAARCVRSLMYKTSRFKAGVDGDLQPQILQDTGTGGSYPVSTDRVVWAIAASRVAHWLEDPERDQWIEAALPILCNTIEQDRALVFDADSGLYRGEQSFLDWREQTYPLWTKANVLGVATSEALSTNVAHHAILSTAARWLGRVDDPRADTYRGWADALREAIRSHLLDATSGLIATYRLVDLGGATRSHQYDLLGQSLAILGGIVNADEGARALRRYPTGPFGPPVQWPQDPTVPIYHNHAIWPFVTAYWIKSARVARAAKAMHAGIASMMRAAALFLSNMENLDFGSGEIEGQAHGLSGPKINSRRQLWSVAGYASLVHDAIFGLETHEGGIRFHPVFPTATRRECFGDATTLTLRNVNYRGRSIDVELTLPDASDVSGELLEPASATLNGEPIDVDRFVPSEHLAEANVWRVALRVAHSAKDDAISVVSEFEDPTRHFGPPAPTWIDGDDADASLPEENAAVLVRCAPIDGARVRYNLYRDGEIISTGHAEPTWRDAIDAGPPRVREYRVEAVYPESGNHSRLSIARRYVPTSLAPIRIACAADGAACGLMFVVEAAGRHGVRVSYANGNGTIDTGLTCAVRRVELRQGDFAAVGHVVLPHTGGAAIYQDSSWFTVDLPAPGKYEVTIDASGEAARNMSYFAHNEVYTLYAGGGPSPCNEATIRYLEVQPLGIS